MIIDKNFILDYFNEYIFGFIFHDIENCIKAKANFAVATLLMAYTEKIGSLINGNLGLSNHSQEDFNKFLEYFEFNRDQNYYNKFDIEFKENEIKKSMNIYIAFRCGLIHQYFPKLPCIIYNNPNDINHYTSDDAGIGWIDHEKIRTLRFHTNAFNRDFKKAFDKIFRQVFVQNDPGLTTKIEESLKRIFNRDLIVL